MLQGRKTYIGIALIVLGWIGFGDLVSESEATMLVDNAIQFVGIVMAIYGRYKVKA